MGTPIKPALQILFCLSLPAMTYYFSRHLASHVPTFPFLDLPTILVLCFLTALGLAFYGWDKAEILRDKRNITRGLILCYGLVVATMVISYCLPSEQLFEYLTSNWFYSRTPLTFDKAIEQVVKNQTNDSELSFSFFAGMAFFASWEEVIFRGLFLSGIIRSLVKAGVRKNLSIGIALGISSLSFALIHGFDKIAVGGLSLLVLGIVAGFLFIRFGLFYACLYHTLFNLATSPAFFDPNSEKSWIGFWYLVGSILALVIVLVQAGLQYFRAHKPE